MADSFQNLKKISQFLLREQFVEIDFYPTATGGGRAQALIEEIVLDDPEPEFGEEELNDIVIRPGGIRIEVFPPGASRPVASMETQNTSLSEQIPALVFNVTQATPGWKCRFSNLRLGRIVECQLVFPKLLHSTAIPMRVLNNAASQLIAAIGLRIHLDGDRSFFEVSEELKEFAGDRIDQQTFFSVPDMHGVTLTSSFLGLIAKQNNSGKSTIRIRLGFSAPEEIPTHIADINIVGTHLTIEIELSTLSSSGNRKIHTEFLFDTPLTIVISPIIGTPIEIPLVDHVEPEARDVYNKISNTVNEFLEKGLMRLARQDHEFYDISADEENFIVKHYDPAELPRQTFEPPTVTVDDETLNPNDLANLENINHIVVLMMENRSFDHMLGYLSLPSWSSEGIDATIHLESNNKTYFFKGNQYVRFTGTKIDEGFPQDLPGEWRGLPSSWHSGIDAALYYVPTKKVYFFKGNEYARLTDTRVDANYPKPFPGGWSGLPSSWSSSGIDAAFFSRFNNKTYFFKGNEYARLTGTAVDANYPKPFPGGWRGLPSSWNTGIDAALYLESNKKTYFFKGNEYARLTDTKVDAGYPKPLPGGWRGLPSSAGRTDINGLTGEEFNVVPDVGITAPIRVHALSDTVFQFSPNHHYEEGEESSPDYRQPVTKQIADGKMSGFLKSFIETHPEAPPDLIMGYYTADQVPTYDFLAQNFSICNNWFCSHPGPTWPNRFCTLTGHTPSLNNFEHTASEVGYVNLPTMFDHLTAADVDWVYYENDVSFLRMFDRYRLDNTHIIRFKDNRDGFKVRAENGRLPPVTFIDPNFVDVPPVEEASDDHPPANIARGQFLIKEIFNILRDSPLWENILFVISYDEHGGFYDHVAPPGTGEADANNPVPKVHPDGKTFYGVRVPGFVISPWVPGGEANNITFDHTSIAKTILLKFIGHPFPNMGPRMQNAANFGSLLTESEPRKDIPRIGTISEVPPSPPIRPPIRLRVDDFHETMRRFGLPPSPRR